LQVAGNLSLFIFVHSGQHYLSSVTRLQC